MVPSGRSVLGWVFSAAVLVCHVQIVATSLGSCWYELCCNWGTFRLQRHFSFGLLGRDNPPSPAKAALQASGGRASIVGLQISFAMAPGKKRQSKGIGKGGAHSNDPSSAIVSRPVTRSSADDRDGPTTRSASSATTLGSLANAGASAVANTGATATATAQGLPRGPDSSALVPFNADQTRYSSEFQQLMRQNAELSQRVVQLTEQLLVQQRTSPVNSPTPATTTTSCRPQSPTRAVDFVPPPPPAKTFRDGLINLSEGAVQFLLAFSVACMGLRMPDVLNLPEHTFTSQLQSGSVVHTQRKSPFHSSIFNYLLSVMPNMPSTWAEFSSILSSAARQNASSFGDHAIVEINAVVHMVTTDLDELKSIAASVSQNQNLDTRLVVLAVSKFREGSPLSVPRALDSELHAIRAELSKRQSGHANRDPQRGGRGRGYGDGPQGKDGKGRGKGGKARAPSLKDTTVIEKSVSLGIFIRKTVRSPHGPAEFRCFKCGSTQHKLDNCLADEDTVAKWVEDAEPAP